MRHFSPKKVPHLSFPSPPAPATAFKKVSSCMTIQSCWDNPANCHHLQPSPAQAQQLLDGSLLAALSQGHPQGI